MNRKKGWTTFPENRKRSGGTEPYLIAAKEGKTKIVSTTKNGCEKRRETQRKGKMPLHFHLDLSIEKKETRERSVAEEEERGFHHL